MELGKLFKSVIVKLITVDKQRVALFHTHIVECVERTGALVEAGTIAKHEHILLSDAHIPDKNLYAGIEHLIVGEAVGMQQYHLSRFMGIGVGHGGAYHRFAWLGRTFGYGCFCRPVFRRLGEHGGE